MPCNTTSHLLSQYRHVRKVNKDWASSCTYPAPSLCSHLESLLFLELKPAMHASPEWNFKKQIKINRGMLLWPPAHITRLLVQPKQRCSGSSLSAVGRQLGFATPRQTTNTASATWHQSQILGVFFFLFVFSNQSSPLSQILGFPVVRNRDSLLQPGFL